MEQPRRLAIESGLRVGMRVGMWVGMWVGLRVGPRRGIVDDARCGRPLVARLNTARSE
ncbi:hypothetical protein BN2475_950077 [Paraburkholderia ribeironis]|uniref:Uncharacterized protein n=1 Tax=Paraburkholderia ribeironis TaxID=1247936 RepID=A0A1N7SLL9_9BURK|nr:hypothetical protein [Paraburkholderia ribeironis]SIT48303.1 hypothetical protein BN2475_950077 [Paraburkholderia ribeironis]